MSKILCRAHNGRLSPLDTSAGAFWESIKAVVVEQAETDTRERIHTLQSGDDLERWLLKTMCNFLVAGAWKGHGREELRATWLDMIFDGRAFPSAWGVYFFLDPEQPQGPVSLFNIETLRSHKNERIIGCRYRFCGISMFLALSDRDTWDDGQMTHLVHRPSYLMMTSSQGRSLIPIGWRQPRPAPTYFGLRLQPQRRPTDLP